MIDTREDDDKAVVGNAVVGMPVRFTLAEIMESEIIHASGYPRHQVEYLLRKCPLSYNIRDLGRGRYRRMPDDPYAKDRDENFSVNSINAKSGRGGYDLSIGAAGGGDAL